MMDKNTALQKAIAGGKVIEPAKEPPVPVVRDPHMQKRVRGAVAKLFERTGVIVVPVEAYGKQFPTRRAFKDYRKKVKRGRQALRRQGMIAAARMFTGTEASA